MSIKNEAQDSSDYSNIVMKPRPGHADLTYFYKYGFYDPRGGGRSSGRETVARVAAGAIAKKLLLDYGVTITGRTIQIGKIKAELNDYSIEESLVRCADRGASDLMVKEIIRAQQNGDSVGGIVEIIADGVPIGVGEPVFDKLEAVLAYSLMSIGGVKGFEVGAGFAAALKMGSENNDQFYFKGDKVMTYTNNCGGVLGGISDGMPLELRIAVKPTPSISIKQRTVDLLKMEPVEIEVYGRHDPCIVPRVVPVAEAMVALTLVDLMMISGKIPQKI